MSGSFIRGFWFSALWNNKWSGILFLDSFDHIPLFLIQNSSPKSIFYKGQDNKIDYNPVFYPKITSTTITYILKSNYMPLTGLNTFLHLTHLILTLTLWGGIIVIIVIIVLLLLLSRGYRRGNWGSGIWSEFPKWCDSVSEPILFNPFCITILPRVTQLSPQY